MKKNLIIKYVGFKLAEQNESFAKAKRELSAEEFAKFVAGTNVSEIRKSFKDFIEEMLQKRFNLQKHHSLFYRPTIGQWISDLTGILTEEDIITALSQSSGIKKEVFYKSVVGDNLLDGLFLEDFVESLELATNRKILKNGHWCKGEDYSYNELAHYFATA